MKNLIIEQRSSRGLLKTWRIRSEQTAATIGSSKFADLRAQDPSVKGIHGRFEYRNNQWVYIHLDLTHENLKDKVEVPITKELELKLGNTVLKLTPYEGREHLFKKETKSALFETGAGKSPYQLFTVQSRGHLLETALVPMKDSFCSTFDPEKTKTPVTQSETWQTKTIQNLEIRQRTVYLTQDEAMAKFQASQVFSKDGRLPLYATLAGAAVLALLFLLSPNSKDAGEAAVAALPPAEYREIKLAPPKKKVAKAIEAAKPVVQSQEPAAVGGAEAPKGGSRALSAIKALGTSRISALIGKVSAGAAKSANVVITNGVAAGTAPSGRALAALGNMNSSGKDWGAEGKTNGAKISTAGIAGGKGVGGMGNLANGKTGTGGAELLEEEGEIVGGLDREIIAQYIRTQLGQILYCYERQLSASPDLFGKVSIRFTIGSKGEVETQRIGDSTLKNATVEGCILQRVAKWKFPTPEGGTKVNVTYPFLFKSTN